MITVHPIDNMGVLVRTMVLGAEDNSTQPENVGDHTVTYGYGYTFIQRDAAGTWFIPRVLAGDLQAIGIRLTDAERNSLEAIRVALNDYGCTRDPVYLDRADALNAQFSAAWSATHVALTDQRAQDRYNRVIDRKGEDIRGQFITFLGTERGNELYQALQNTREMAGLLDMAYNGLGLIVLGLTRALWNGHRAEAWFEIRCNSNPDRRDLTVDMLAGLAKRRYMDAQFIGLFFDPAHPTMPEVSAAFKMLQRHREPIRAYEQLYGYPVDGGAPTRGNRIDTANAHYAAVILAGQAGGLANVLSIEQSLDGTNGAAKAALVDALRTEYQNELAQELPGRLTPDNNGQYCFRSVDIYLNPSYQTDRYRQSWMTVTPSVTPRDSLLVGMDQMDRMTGGDGDDVLLGGAGADCLYGGPGSDVLVGGAGDDRLYGNPGSDFLYGGANNDSYYIYLSDLFDVDQIEDQEGINTVYVDGVPFRRFIIEQGQLGVYHSPDRGRTWIGRYENDDFLVEIGPNQRVILTENFQEGDFGIRFYDELTPEDNPVTNNIVQGDQDPLRLNDKLADTAGNDLILAGAGDDDVRAIERGSDWIKGEDGCDLLDGDASTNCIIEGGAGSDVLFGSYVTGSQIFADGYGEKEALIAAGETAEGTGGKGDLICGGYPGGDNFLYGSNGNGILRAPGGRDFMVGGGGDALIISDYQPRKPGCSGNLGVDELLCAKGADVAPRPKRHGTPLMHATER